MSLGVAPKKTCTACLYYIKSKRHCLLLNRRVDDPGNPLCVVREKPRREVAEAPPPAPAVSAPRVEPGPVDVVRRPSNPVGVQRVEEAPPAPVANVAVVGGGQAAYASVEPAPPPVVAPRVVSRDYAPTGIPRLDDILGGGFLRGKTYLVAGETGCGKTIFSLQFLIYGALNGEPGVYIAIDEPTTQLLRGLKNFGWDVSELISDGKLLFLDMRAHFSKIYLRDERRRIEPKYVIESILNATKKVRAKRLVIDPIAPLIYGGKKEDVLYAREFLREMVFALERIGELTTILTSEIPTGSRQLSRFGVEEFLATGIIMLSVEEINGEIERVMYVRKARWAPVKPSKYVFDIVQGQGIIIKAPFSEYLKSRRGF